MNHFLRHIPRYIDQRGIENDVFEFESIDELLEIDYVKLFKQMPKFSHYAISDVHLMAIFDSGYRWLVAGRIESPEKVDLPRWSGAKYRPEWLLKIRRFFNLS